MNILITAGGTAEPIDAVRSITNMATGRLGSFTADAFAEYAEVDSIYYICGKTSLFPETDKAKIIKIQGTDELKTAITQVLTQNKIDVCIHSMAVSDYSVRSVTTIQNITEEIKSRLSSGDKKGGMNRLVQEAFRQAETVKNDGKIRSDKENLVLVLQQTPKIISLIKDLSPNTLLVGFKLLDNVSAVELLDTAYRLLLKNRCDYILANDLSEISGQKHVGYLIYKDKSIQRFTDKKKIAAGIAETVMKKLMEKG